MTSSSLLTAAFLAVAAPHLLRAAHFDIKLSVSGPNAVTKEAYADEAPPVSGLNPRPVFRAHAGDSIAFQFVMTNVYAHASAKNAGVHYYIVQEREAGQKTLPPPEERPVVEGRWTFDLKPQARIAAKERFVIRQPGVYLLRVESLRTQRDHEHFSALDLVIQ